MKKKILVLAALAIAVAIAATGALAYFTATGTARNVITSGGISIAIEEKTQTGDALVDFPREGLQGIMPGATASKIVRIKNTGPNEAWIRVQLASYITDSDKKEELPDNSDRRIFVFERASQFELLSQNPETFMWVSAIPQKLLQRYGLTQRVCEENRRVYKDVLIYRRDYTLGSLDNLFIEQLVKAKRDVIG